MRSLLVFLGLFILSVLCLWIWPDHKVVKGLLLVLWAGFALTRGLWLTELVFFNHLKDPSDEPLERIPLTLAGALQSVRSRGLMREECYKASHAFSDKMLIWGGLAALCGFWMVYTVFLHETPHEYADLSIRMRAYMLAYAALPLTDTYQELLAVTGWFSDLFLIFLVYVLAQTYATSASQGRILLFASLGVLVAVFASCLLYYEPPTAIQTQDLLGLNGQWIGYGFGASRVLQSMEIIPYGVLSSFQLRVFEIGMGGGIFFYVIGLYQLLLFLGALGRDWPRRFSALGGMAILALLFGADKFLPSGSALEALWLSGWLSLSVLSVQSRSLGYRKDTMRQI